MAPRNNNPRVGPAVEGNDARRTIQWMRDRGLDAIIPYLNRLCNAPRDAARYSAAYQLNENTQYARKFGHKSHFYVRLFKRSSYEDYEEGKDKVVEILISTRDGTIAPASVAHIRAVTALIQAPAALGN